MLAGEEMTKDSNRVRYKAQSQGIQLLWVQIVPVGLN